MAKNSARRAAVLRMKKSAHQFKRQSHSSNEVDFTSFWNRLLLENDRVNGTDVYLPFEAMSPYRGKERSAARNGRRGHKDYITNDGTALALEHDIAVIMGEMGSAALKMGCAGTDGADDTGGGGGGSAAGDAGGAEDLLHERAGIESLLAKNLSMLYSTKQKLTVSKHPSDRIPSPNNPPTHSPINSRSSQPSSTALRKSLKQQKEQRKSRQGTLEEKYEEERGGGGFYGSADAPSALSAEEEELVGAAIMQSNQRNLAIVVDRLKQLGLASQASLQHTYGFDAATEEIAHKLHMKQFMLRDLQEQQYRDYQKKLGEQSDPASPDQATIVFADGAYYSIDARSRLRAVTPGFVSASKPGVVATSSGYPAGQSLPIFEKGTSVVFMDGHYYIINDASKLTDVTFNRSSRTSNSLSGATPAESNVVFKPPAVRAGDTGILESGVRMDAVVYSVGGDGLLRLKHGPSEALNPTSSNPTNTSSGAPFSSYGTSEMYYNTGSDDDDDDDDDGDGAQGQGRERVMVFINGEYLVIDRSIARSDDSEYEVPAGSIAVKPRTPAIGVKAIRSRGGDRGDSWGGGSGGGRLDPGNQLGRSDSNDSGPQQQQQQQRKGGTWAYIDREYLLIEGSGDGGSASTDFFDDDDDDDDDDEEEEEEKEDYFAGDQSTPAQVRKNSKTGISGAELEKRRSSAYNVKNLNSDKEEEEQLKETMLTFVPFGETLGLASSSTSALSRKGLVKKMDYDSYVEMNSALFKSGDESEPQLATKMLAAPGLKAADSGRSAGNSTRTSNTFEVHKPRKSLVLPTAQLDLAVAPLPASSSSMQQIDDAAGDTQNTTINYHHHQQQQLQHGAPPILEPAPKLHDPTAMSALLEHEQVAEMKELHPEGLPLVGHWGYDQTLEQHRAPSSTQQQQPQQQTAAWRRLRQLRARAEWESRTPAAVKAKLRQKRLRSKLPYPLKVQRRLKKEKLIS